MSQSIKTPKSVTMTLAGGFVLGGLCVAGIYSGAGFEKAMGAPEVQVKPRLMSSGSTESTLELHNLDSSFRSLARFASPAVVDIHAKSKRSVSPDGTRMPESEGEGSGFLFSPDGYIATNDHVVGTADTVQVTMKDGRQYTGKVVRANDANSDIALVKIDAKDLPYLSFADSKTVEPGEFVMAIGAPFGLQSSVSVGHVSALGRESQIENHVYTDFIQTDAAINMGNSGGPLINVDGQVIGMNTAIYSPTGGSNGIGFAIPGSQVKLIENLLVTKGAVVRSMLGVIPTDVKEYEKTSGSPLSGGGARVDKIAGEPAQSAGLQKDDVIVRIGHTDIHDQMDLRNAMLIYTPGSQVPVEYIRNGKRETTQIKLLAYKAPPKETAPRQLGQREFQGNPFQGMPGNPFGQFGNPFNDNGSGSTGGGDDENSDQQPSAPHTGAVHLGVQVGDVDDATKQQFNIPAGTQGAVVANVVPGSVASSIGIQSGDVIQSFNGKTISTAKDLTAAISALKWGAVAHISFVHYDQGGQILKTETDVKFK